MKYFDVHAHTNLSPLLEDVDKVAKECEKNEITFVCVGTNINTSHIAAIQAKAYKNVYATIGIHPTEVENIDVDVAIHELDAYLANHKESKILAIGETGLDYHFTTHNNVIQKYSFIKHIELAKKYNLALMIHVRDAHEDCISILNQHAQGLRIIIHCFSADQNIALQYVNLGCWISFPGIITFNKRVADVHLALKNIPINKILSETDSPFIAPEPMRGKTNTPQYVIYIVQVIAKILNIPLEQMQQQLVQNAKNAYSC